MQLTPFGSLDKDEYQSGVVGIKSGDTSSVKLKMALCYAKFCWV